MKKRIFAIGIMLTASFLLCSCGKNEAMLNVDNDIIRMKVDGKETIKIQQENVENVEWTSADETVAVVSTDGTVTAIGSGITTVTAQTEDSYVHVGVVVQGNSEYVDKDGNVIEIFNEHSDITEIRVAVKGGGAEDITVGKGEKHQLIAQTTPESEDKIVWKSKDAKIAAVSEDGVLSPVKSGITTVTAYAPNGVKGEIIVRVK